MIGYTNLYKIALFASLRGPNESSYVQMMMVDRQTVRLQIEQDTYSKTLE